jgi:hypothetical protein
MAAFDIQRAEMLEELADLAREAGDEEAELIALEEMAKMRAEVQALASQSNKQPGILQQIGNVGLEAAAGVNRGAAGLVDFAASLPNAVMDLAGSDKRIPSAVQALAPATTGNFMGEGLARDVVRQGSELIPSGVATGAALRQAAAQVPAMAQPTATQGVIQQLGSSTAAQDALYGGLSGAGSKLGEEAGRAVGGETGAQIGTLAGGIAAPGIVAGGAGLARAVSQRSDEIAARIASGDTSRDLAQYRIDPNTVNSAVPRAIPDRQAANAIKQGFDDGVISAIKQTDTSSKKKMLKMALTAEAAKKDAVYGSYNRPSDVVGDSLFERLRFVRQVNTKAGKELDGVAKSLRGQQADAETPIRNFYAQLDDLGVSFTDDGVPDFRGSDIEGVAGAEKAIKQILGRVNTLNGDAYDMHRLKRFIDEQVAYGKNAEGLTGKSERILKGLRADIDSSLDSQFPAYNDVNTRYSDTIQALDAFQDAAGTKVNLFGENADKALGTVSRRLLSNTQSRVNMMDSIKNLEDVSLKYGSKFEDDIMSQVLFADELDKLFGAAARTSLQGDVGKGVKRGLETASGNRSLSGLAIDAAASGIEKARGINEENAFKAIKELLKREIK